MIWKPIADKTFFLAESALYDPFRKCYFFVDIFDGTLYQYQNGALRDWHFDCILSACLLTEDGALVLATQRGIGLFDPDTGRFTKKVHPNAPFETQTRYNDCKCDPAGRLLAGTMDLHGASGQGKLYSIGPNWQASLLLDRVDYSNGIVWLGDAMYYTDTYSGNVYRFTYDLTAGTCGKKEVLCTFPAGQPDGMAADGNGMLWIALWGGHGLAQVDPATGTILRRVPLPVPVVSSLCFGPHGQVLVTTARKDMTPEALKKYPLASSVFLGTLEVPGAPFFPYRPEA